eukprot:CAMPEP_0174862492 /NCGR_PEP_ID=MMETSP1114-20130205/54210_1 /TAXON_ID=312471 /ORGANISM="Neobodo designis, Strain CCAP 1951/1" /LENGTH=52 /DNA_ID=CAMNT_0016097541 /DNA_START=73 /DNA_END=228 /DNA_ORIENTATION=+
MASAGFPTNPQPQFHLPSPAPAEGGAGSPGAAKCPRGIVQNPHVAASRGLPL